MLRAKKKFARFLLIMVSGLGLCSTALLLTDPPPADPSNIDMEEGASLFSLNSSILQSKRDLASANSISTVKPDSILELDCNEDQQVFETARARFRLKGESCLETAKQETSSQNSGDNQQGPTATQVQNESNGYVATVFHRNSIDFTTDFINLSEGENKIKVVFNSDSGPLEKVLTVIRKTASTKK